MPRKPSLASAHVHQTRVRVAIYTRRSTDAENQPFTIESRSRSSTYVALQDDWTIVVRYCDDASGATIDRPSLVRALTAARAGQFDVLLPDELDTSGMVFRSATEPFDTSTPIGRMLVHMLGVFAEFEREMIIDRVVTGMERKAAQGQWTLGIPPYVTDYENGKIDQGLLERRIDKLGRDLQDLRRHRDELQLRLDTEPQLHPGRTSLKGE